MNPTILTKDQYTLNPDGTITLAASSVPSLTDVASDWISARAGETSTKLGVLGGAVATPTILDNAGQAIIAGLAGNYIACAQHGIPALIGIVGAIAAIVTPDKPQPPTGPTHEQIKATLSTLSLDELVGLLREPVTAQSVIHAANQSTATNQLQSSAAVLQSGAATTNVATAVS